MCPCCEQGNLHPTGILWFCDTCGLAITEPALEMIRAHDQKQIPAPESGRPGKAETTA